jgi:hypothetical protein
MSASETVGNIVGVLKVEDQASGAIGMFNSAANSLFGTLQNLGGGFQDFGNIAQSAFSGFAVGGPVGAAIGGATAAIDEAVQGIQASVKAAATLQGSWSDLQASLHLTGAAWDAMKAQVQGVVDVLMQTSTFSDTQLISSFQRLTTYGMSSAQAMDALKAATELAAAKHIDLETASTALGKAFQGNSMLLVRYGVNVDTVTKQLSLGGEAIKEMGVNLATASSSQLSAFATAMSDAGLKTADASGKMLSHAAIVKEIESAWKAGSISGDQLSAIVGALGINFQGSKALAMDYSNVLAQVNTQYGGAAEAQASTYAGLQERLGNAWQVLSEKVGTMLLPALSSITEALIPIVDSFGKGVDAVSAWLAEVAKIPEVKSILDGFGAMWNGLTKYFMDAWDAVQKDLWPALQELGGTLKDLFDALKPVFDAFGELMAAFGTGGDSINPLKILIEFLVLEIKGLVVVIQAIIPIVKFFAAGFKEAADIIAPPLTWLVGAIKTALTDIHSAFQAFYDWLIGKSLWPELWDAVGKIAMDAISGLVDKVGSKFFKPLQDGFTSAVSTVKSTWATIGPAVTGPLDEIAAKIKDKFPEMSGIITAGTDLMKGDWSDAWTQIQGVADTGIANLTGAIRDQFPGLNDIITGGTELLRGNWETGLQKIVAGATENFEKIKTEITTGFFQPLTDGFNTISTGAQVVFNQMWSGLQTSAVSLGTAVIGSLQASYFDPLQTGFATATKAVAGIWDTFTKYITDGIAGLKTNLASAQASLSSTFDAMKTTTTNALSSISSQVSNAMSGFAQQATNLWNSLTHHSIWPNMLGEMVSQTQTAMGAISDAFSAGFEAPGGILPMFQTAQGNLAANLTPSLQEAGNLSGTSTSSQSQALTIPISVYLDGQLIQTQIERKLVETIIRDANRSKRS